VKPPPFSYAAPTTLSQAIGLLTEHAAAEPRVLAGGQSLIPLMNFRLAKPGYLIDLRNVAGLSGVRQEHDSLVIGAMTRLSELARSAEVAAAAPLLAEAVGFIAHAPVRNRGTIGGSLAHADPAAELPAVALASEAELVPRCHPTRSSPRSGCRGGTAGTRSPSSPGLTATSPWSQWPR
jgi:aerobic carbon-monoxide dehydrogenase medium subunit